MNLAWLWLIIPPPYFLIAGYVYAVAVSKGVEDNGEIPISMLWPLSLLVITLWHIMKMGMHLHGPERKRKREAAIARNEQAIYGRTLTLAK